MNPEKLSQLQASVRIGGKGTPRRKLKKAPVHKGVNGSVSSAAGVESDKKIAAALRKLNAQMIPSIEEVNLFKEDGNIINITAPVVQASVMSNTFCISGHTKEKPLAEMIPGILNQLGPDSISSLRRVAESFSAQYPGKLGSANSSENKQAGSDDDDIPTLVENFDAAHVSA